MDSVSKIGTEADKRKVYTSRRITSSPVCGQLSLITPRTVSGTLKRKDCNTRRDRTNATLQKRQTGTIWRENKYNFPSESADRAEIYLPCIEQCSCDRVLAESGMLFCERF